MPQPRKDPLPVFCFLVQIDGFEGEVFFKSVSGLRYETEILPVREGGQNATTFQLVGATKWSNLVLKQGFTKDSGVTGLLKWRDSWLQPRGGVRADGKISLLDTALQTQTTWSFTRGWPVKWEISEFDASKSELAIETLEIAHEGLSFT